jgi:aldehyde dehydrogenase (NAD+)
MAYTRPRAPSVPAPIPQAMPAPAGGAEPAGTLDRTAKLFVGGRQARPDGGYSRAVWGADGRLIGHVGEGNRKDIRNAVEAAAAASGWARASGHLRAQILYYLAENLSARGAEFAARIDALTGTAAGAAEVEAAVDRLFTYGAWADKFDGAAKGVPLRGLALALNEPVGVIGALCPHEAPLLGLISAMAPAIAMGNRVVLVPSEPFPLAATDFYQVLETSDVPAGVVNIVTGGHEALSDTLARHAEVDSVWLMSDPALAARVERAAAGNLKRTWVWRRDWVEGDAEGREALREATEVKTVWVPYGEG